eukprot:1707076-Amphidinium_carterae.1
MKMNKKTFLEPHQPTNSPPQYTTIIHHHISTPLPPHSWCLTRPAKATVDSGGARSPWLPPPQHHLLCDSGSHLST